MKYYLIILSLCFFVNIANGQTTDDKTTKSSDTTKVFMSVEIQPDYPGGFFKLMSFLQENLKYPRSAQKDGVKGKVMVTFIVEKDGSLTEISVSKHLSADTDQEAIRLVQAMPKWIPGMAAGKPVRVKFTMPITFPL